MARQITFDRNEDGTLRFYDRNPLLEGDERYPQNMRMVKVFVRVEDNHYVLMVPVAASADDESEIVAMLTHYAEAYDFSTTAR